MLLRELCYKFYELFFIFRETQISSFTCSWLPAHSMQSHILIQAKSSQLLKNNDDARNIQCCKVLQEKPSKRMEFNLQWEKNQPECQQNHSCYDEHDAIKMILWCDIYASKCSPHVNKLIPGKSKVTSYASKTNLMLENSFLMQTKSFPMQAKPIWC